MLQSGVAIFDLDYDVIISAMYPLSFSAEGDCYRCVPPDPGIAAAALGASASGTPPSTAPAEALHTFTLDSGASRCFFRDNTTLTPLPAPVPVRLADPSGGPVVARSSTVLPCPAIPSGSLSGLHLPSFSTNLVSTAAQHDAMVTTTTHGGSSLYTLATEPPQVAASTQVSASCSCRLLSHQTLLWHHRLGHPSLPRLRGMHSRLLVSGLPRSLSPLQPSPAPPCLPCVEGRQHAAPHSSSFPPTTAPLQTLHMDVKGQVSAVLIPWIRTVRLQLRERFDQDLLSCSFMLPDSPQQNGIAEHRIGLVMEFARTSMIHAAAPHFLWPFAVRYAAHQLNLWPRVSLQETSPTLRWTGKVGDVSMFRVWGSRAFVRDTSADKLSACSIPCVFLGFVHDAPGWQFYHPTSRRVLPSQDVTFNESVTFYCLFPYRSAPPPPPPLFLAPGPPPVDPLLPQGPAPLGVSQVDPLPGTVPVQVAVVSGATAGTASGGAASGGVKPGGVGSEGAGSRGAEPEGVEPGGAESEGAESGGAEPQGAASSGGPAGASPEAPGAGGAGNNGAGGAAVPTGAVIIGGVGCAGAGDPTEPGAAGAVGAGVGVAGVGGPGAGGAGAAGAGVGGTGAGGAGAAGAGAVDPGVGGIEDTVRTRPYFVPLLQQSVVSLSVHRAPRSRPPPVPGTHTMALRPSSVPLHVPLPAPPESSLPEVPNPESDRARAASSTVARLLATTVTEPYFESAAASALVAELLDFAAACRLDYATALVAESVSASPPSVRGECALGTDVLEDRQEDFEYIPTPRSYAEAITGPYSSQWQAAMDAEMASLKSTGTYVDAVSPSRANIVDGMWIFRLHSLDFNTSLPPFYVLVYVNNLVFATADTEALTLVKSELQKRNTCTDLGELRSYLGLQITRDRARCTIILTLSHMVHQVLQRFGFQYSSPQLTPLCSSHSLSAPPSDKSPAGAGRGGGAAAAGLGGARTRAGDPTEPGGAGAGGTGAGGAGAGGAGAGDLGAVGARAGGTGAGGSGDGGAGARDTGAVDPGARGAGAEGAVSGGTRAGGTMRPRPYFDPLLQQPASPLPAPSPYTVQIGGLTECREPESRPASPIRAVCTGCRVPCPRPPSVPGTHAMALRPSSVPLRVPLPPTPESSLPTVPDPESDLARAANPTVSRLLATVVTDPSFELSAAPAFVAELVDFAAACRLDYTTALVAESESASPPSIGGECALGTDVLEDRQEDFECLAAAIPRFASMPLAPEGDPDAPDIPTPRSYAEAITDPTSRANIVDGMWIFRVKRPSGSPPAFKARYITRGFSQRQGVHYFQTFSPSSKMTTLLVLVHVATQRDYELHSLDFSTAFLQGSLHEEIWLRRPPGFTGSTTRAALGFTPSTADPSLFLRTDTSLPPFYVLVYVLQRFGFEFSLPQTTPLSTGHSLSDPPSDEWSIPRACGLPHYVGMGLVLGGRGPVVLTGHADASWVDDLATQQLSPGYTFSLGSSSISWLSTRSSLVLSCSCEAEIYAGAMAAQELRWFTYLLTDLGEQPRSPFVPYVDNKAMLALCQEHILEHRTKHIALRYFLARELQQRGQLRLAYVGGCVGAEYTLTFIDAGTRYVWVVNLEACRRSYEAFRLWLAHAQWQSGEKLKIWQSDGAAEFRSKEIQDYLSHKGIKHHVSLPYAHQHQGVAEHTNRTLMTKVRVLLKQSKLPLTHWTHAMHHAVQMHNLLSTTAITGNLSPHLKWTGMKGDTSMLRVWGCMVQYRPPTSTIVKFASRARWGIHLGISRKYKSWLILDLISQKVTKARDVIFYECLFLGQFRKDKRMNANRVYANNGHIYATPEDEAATAILEQDTRGEFTRGDRRSGDDEDPLGGRVGGGGGVGRVGGSGGSAVAPPEPESDDNAVQEVIPQHHHDSTVSAGGHPAASPRQHSLTGPHNKKWREAMDAQINALESRDTWVLVYQAAIKGRRILLGKWVFRVKTAADGTI
ncbi:unnamed protein product [Closterium sp. NIES-53]